jgi:acetyl/propionyl-CoA carboxylase alpha subunit
MREKVLVFGPSRGVTLRIASQLKEAGLDPLVPGLSDDRLPSLSDPDATRKMGELLKSYRDQVQWLHPGLSAWAERPELPTLGDQAGMSVISPAPRVLSLFGNKLTLFEKGEELGIPNLVIDPEPMHSLREIEKFVRSCRQKFPFIMKTAKGGSRFGLTAFHEATELESKLPLWLEQIRNSCGEVILFAERYLEGSRLISVPFARFIDGRSTVFPLIDASLQCRHRKVIEFCPAPSISDAIQNQIEEWTLSLAKHCNYVGVGALEFLIDSDRAYLIGGSPRLHAAFHLWEKVAGTQAVAWQLAALQGGKAVEFPAQKPEKKWQSAVALRLYAEDSVLQLPQPGVVHQVIGQKDWDFSIGKAELDLMVESGQSVSPGEQGWIGTLWVGSTERSQVMKLAQGVLDQIWIAGSLQTNERFLAELLQHPWVREGMFHTGFIDEEFLPSLRAPAELIRLFASALEAMGEGRPGFRWAVGDQWVKTDPSLIEWVSPPESWSELEGETSVTGLSGVLRISDGRQLKYCAYPLAEGRWQVRLGAWVMIVRRAPGKSAEKPKPKISSLIPGKVHSILFRDGAMVQAHEPILIVESLGMLIPHALPVDVRIERWKVLPEQKVHAGQELAEFQVLAKT